MKLAQFDFAYFNRAVLSTALAASLVACGGGGGGGSDSTGTGSRTVSSAGVITAFGSVVVNGVHFDESSASVLINDAGSSAGNHKGLKIGMTVKIKGTSDGTRGSATDIEAAHEVEARITSIDPVNKTFVVLDQTVFTDDQTLYDSIANFDGLVLGMQVEVYGLRDANGIHATLVEIELDSEFEDELRGTVSDLTSETFQIGGLTIDYDENTVFEDGDASGLVDGATVEVHLDSNGANPNLATKIELEDNEDDKFAVGDRDDMEVEGYVLDFNVHPGTFQVGSVEVQTTSTTKFEGPGTLANDVKIEVEGVMSGGVLVAHEVSFE